MPRQLCSRERTPVPTELEALWVPGQFWTFWGRQKYLAGILTPARPARSPVLSYKNFGNQIRVHVRSLVLALETINLAVTWDVTLRSRKCYRRFRGTCCLQPQDTFPETSVHLHQTTRRHASQYSKASFSYCKWSN